MCYTGEKMLKKAKILVYVSGLLYPKYPGYYFPIYMFILYVKIRGLRKTFSIATVANTRIKQLISKCNEAIFDCNNTVCVPEQHFKAFEYRQFATLELSDGTKRVVQTIFYSTDKCDRILVNDTLFYNLKTQEKALVIPYETSNLTVAKEVNISLVNTYCDISNAIVDVLVKNYFKSPKLIKPDDLIAISIEEFAPEYYYNDLKCNHLKTLYFKCNRVEPNKRGVLCISDKTTLKQSANVQSDLPIRISIIPYGFQDIFSQIETAIRTFLKNEKLHLKPAFLIEGNRGVGKKKIVDLLSQKLGFHLYLVGSENINSNAYAQTETKLKHVFFKAKLCTPCILCITDFENFGKNNEGVYDTRLMSFFLSELNILFENNNHPLMLLCTSNTEIPSELSRAFLERFEMKNPDEKQRLGILRGILEKYKLEVDGNLQSIAEKTPGFLYGDLEALLYHSFVNVKTERKLNDQDFEKALSFMQANFGKSLGTPKIPEVKWSDVGGLEDVKHEIIRTINLPLRHPNLVKKSGLKRSGILLYGPPGTGKTLIAKAVATECSLHFLSVKGPELLNMYVGQSERNVREVFERAREAAPCVIFFDELDSLAPNRGNSGDSGGVMDRVVSQLLAEMDGLNRSATIFVIGATNRPDLIDHALLRPGRFDKLLYIGPCTSFASKLGVLRAQTRKFNLSPMIKLEDIVKNCPDNVTGADFYGVCSNAWLMAARRLINDLESGSVKKLENQTHEDVIVELEDFETAMGELSPSIKPADLIYFEKLQKDLAVSKK